MQRYPSGISRWSFPVSHFRQRSALRHVVQYLLFADDIKLISAHSPCSALHQGMEASFQWSDDCDLQLNASNYSHISVSECLPSSLTLTDLTEISAVDTTDDNLLQIGPQTMMRNGKAMSGYSHYNSSASAVLDNTL